MLTITPVASACSNPGQELPDTPPAHVPAWLLERIDRALEARRLVGDDVSPEHNARDQIAAFRVHVVHHQPHVAGAWLGLPDPELEAKLLELESLMRGLD